MEIIFFSFILNRFISFLGIPPHTLPWGRREKKKENQTKKDIYMNCHTQIFFVKSGTTDTPDALSDSPWYLRSFLALRDPLR